MDRISDYEQWKAERQRSGIGAAQVVMDGQTQSPDEVAGDLTLAQEYAKATGLPQPPAQMLPQYRSIFQQEIDRKRNETILSSSPRLTEWLRNEENAAVARDDLEGLSWWETSLGASGNALGRGVRRVPQAYNQTMANRMAEQAQDRERSLGEIIYDERRPIMSDGEEVGRFWAGPGDALGGFWRYALSRTLGATPEDAAAYQQRAGEMAQNIAAIPMSPAGERFKTEFAKVGDAGDWRAQLSQFVTSAAEDPGGLMAFLTETAVESVPSLAAATGVTAATRNPAAGALFMGAASGATEYGLAPVEFFDEKGIDVSTPEGAMAAISDPQLMQEAAQRGVIRGVIIGAMDGLSGGVAGQTLAKSRAGDFALQAITQAVMGASGEAAAQVAAGQELNLGEVIVEGLAEFVTAPIEAAGVGGRAFVDSQRAARDVEARVGLFQELSGQSVNSKTRARMPEKFRQFVERATADGPVENVYIPADQFTTYFQSQDIDPYELIDALPGVTRDDLELALAGGGDIQIPTSTYATEIAGSEHDAFLMQNMRFDPDQMTASEAEEFNARAQEAMEEAWQIAEDARLEDEAWRSEEQKIYDEMVSRLRVAGRSTEVATNEAMIYPAFYRVMAERSGLSTEEFLARYPLPQVQGAIPHGMQARNVDELNRTLAEVRQRRDRGQVSRGRPAAAALRDRGGVDPQGPLAAELRSRGITPRTSPGLFRRGGLKSADNIPASEVEIMAYSGQDDGNGYVPEQAWIDALEAEGRGEPWVGWMGEEDAARQAELDQIEEYLSQIGASLDQTDEEIRAAIEAAQADDARMYGQDGQVNTGSEAFKAWFGDSKVVDESGQPLVVYHGTGTVIEEFNPDLTGQGNDQIGSGFYFTTDRSEAESYQTSVTQNAGPGARKIGGDDSPNVIDAYLSITNPITVNGSTLNDTDVELTQEQARAIISRAPDLYDVDETPLGNWHDVWDGGVQDWMIDDVAGSYAGPNLVSLEGDFFRGDATAFRTALRDVLGYDGVHQVFENGKSHWVAWFPEQIKSVDNRGTFDRDDPRIYHQDQRASVEEWKASAAGRPKHPNFFDMSGDPRVAAFIDSLSEAGDQAAAEAMSDQWVKKEGLRTGAEHLVAFDTGGGLIAIGSGSRSSIGFPPELMVAAEEGAIQYATHNHPSNSGFSVPDLTMSAGYGFDMSAIGHGGAVVSGRAGPALAGKGYAPQFIGNLMADVDGQIQRVIQDRINDGTVDINDAIKAHSHIVDIVRHRFGLLDLRSNGADIVREAGFDIDEILSATEEGVRNALQRSNFNVPALRDYVGDQAPGGSFSPQRRGGGAAGVPEAGGGAEGRSGNPLPRNDPRQLKLFQRRETGPRGQISIDDAGQSVINLFESADLSTMMHESGHFFLLIMQDLAAKGEGQAVAEYEAVKSWWRENAKAVAADGLKAMPDTGLTESDVIAAIDTGTTGDVMKDAAVDVGMQEQWARAFEAYLMEGKAPSVELRGAFEKFRAWLLSIYKRLAGLNVPMSDDIRQVFDRMLASDAEIEEARRSSGDGDPIFPSAEAMGLTEEEYQQFMRLRSRAEDDAHARLLKEAMEPIKRERDKWYRDEKANMRDEVESELNTAPVYRAIEWMGNRRWLGDGQPEAMPDFRLSKSALVDRYGEGVLKTLPRGKFTVYTVDGGLDPDVAAGWFGFGSGDELIQAMERAQPRRAAITAETERRMYERHGDVLRDGRAEEIALDAVHSDRKGQWIARELEVVRKITGDGVGLTAKEARASARATLARMTVRDAMNANRFLAAERKAGNEAQRLSARLSSEGYWENRARFMATSEDGTPQASAGQRDQVAALYDAKRRQLVNHALYMESRKIADEVSGAERYIRRLNKASRREKIAGAGRREDAQIDYLAAIDEIQGRYDFRRMSGAAEDRRGALQAYIDGMVAQGRENELAIPERVLSDTARRPYKRLSVEELRGVVDSLKNLEHVALRWNEIIDERGKRLLDESAADIRAAMDANMKKRPAGRVKSVKEDRRRGVRQYLDLVLNAGTLLREIDGFEDMGAAYRNMKRPIDEAMDRLTVRREQAAQSIEDLYSVYTREERRKMSTRQHIPELGYALSKWEMISVALNTGNEGNFQRLTNGQTRGSMTEAQVRAVLSRLDARDADFVQSVWDYLGTFTDDIDVRERRTTGVGIERVEASPVEIAGKTLRGGYYPIKYDPRLSSLIRDAEANDIAQAMNAGRFAKAQTKNGHLQARAQNVNEDIELDMSAFHRHVNQVIYDLELSEAVNNSWRLLHHDEVRSGFAETGRSADFDAMESWLMDVSKGQVSGGDWMSGAARMVKRNFTAAKLALNLSTVLLQVTGLAQTSVVVGKRDFARGIGLWLAKGGPAGSINEEVAAKSTFMRERATTFNKDIMDFYDDPKLGPTAGRWGEFKRDIWGRIAFLPMTVVQYRMADVPTWLAGYEQGLRRFDGDETAAIEHADNIVKRAQASGLFSDRSAIERGTAPGSRFQQSDVIRLFTTLGSYMFAKANVAYERSAVAGRRISEGGMSAASVVEVVSYTTDMLMLFMVEALLYGLIKGRLPDEEDDEDGDGMTDEWAKFLARETGLSVLGTMPFLRDVSGPLSGFDGGGAYGAITTEIAKPFLEASQGEIDRGLAKSVVNGVGLMTGAPSTQINRALDAGWRQAEGEDVSPLEYLLGRMR